MRPAGDDVVAALLAGGRSSRMGRDKALLELGGATLLDRACEALSARFARVLVSLGASPGLELERAIAGLAVVGVRDERPEGTGPLAGIEAVLGAALGAAVFVVPVDLPFFDGPLVDRLLERWHRGDLRGVVAGTPRGPEPLVGVYSTALLPAIRARLDRGERAVRALLDEPGVVIVDVDGNPALERALLNVNTLEDWRRALEGDG